MTISTNGIPPTRDRVLFRLKELDGEIEKLGALVKERDLLQNYLAILDQIAPVAGTPPSRETTSSEEPGGLDASHGIRASQLPKVPRYVSNPTADVAYEVLKRSGPLKLSDLMKKARENKSWKSSGDDKKDRDRLWAAMYRDPKRFMKSADSKWDAKR